jgi:hypothetical protein
MMHDLWEVLLIKSNLAKKKGKHGNVIDKKGIKQSIPNNGLTKMVIIDEKKQPVATAYWSVHSKQRTKRSQLDRRLTKVESQMELQAVVLERTP